MRFAGGVGWEELLESQTQETELKRQMLLRVEKKTSRVTFGNGPNTVFGQYCFTELGEFFWPSPSSGENWRVPFGRFFVCQGDLTEFSAEITKFDAELSEFSLAKQCSRNSIPPVS